jgi:hypothetical protein
MGHDIHEVANRRCAQSFDAVCRRGRKASLDYQSASFTCAVVACGAINLEPLPSPFERFPRYRDWKFCEKICPNLSTAETLVIVELSAGNRMRDDRSRSHVIVLKEIALAQGFARRLVEHVTAATDRRRRDQ